MEREIGVPSKFLKPDMKSKETVASINYRTQGSRCSKSCIFEPNDLKIGFGMMVPTSLPRELMVCHSIYQSVLQEKLVSIGASIVFLTLVDVLESEYPRKIGVSAYRGLALKC